MAMKDAAWLKRALFHTGSGLAVVAAALVLPRTLLLSSLAGGTIMFLCFELTRLRASAVNRWFLRRFRWLLREDEASRPTGSSYFLVSAVIVFLAFPREVAILALSFLAVGDAAAAVIGRRLGGRRLLGKTLAGDLACLASCLAIGLILSWIALDVPFALILVGSAGAALMEAAPLPINDNLTIPLFAGGVMALMFFLA
ncbi:MAG TPA: hypothetical protein G4O03_05250 [Dehalococcoidia bacterium]|jgi:dolichol kinase|nr:hypothetical protein [Dehalococcoidia bacterium]